MVVDAVVPLVKPKTTQYRSCGLGLLQIGLRALQFFACKANQHNSDGYKYLQVSTSIHKFLQVYTSVHKCAKCAKCTKVYTMQSFVACCITKSCKISLFVFSILSALILLVARSLVPATIDLPTPPQPARNFLLLCFRLNILRTTM